MSDIKVSGVRVHPWINTETLEPMFGVQVRVERGKWHHLAVKGKAAIYTKKADADRQCSELKLRYAIKRERKRKAIKPNCLSDE